MRLANYGIAVLLMSMMAGCVESGPVTVRPRPTDSRWYLKGKWGQIITDFQTRDEVVFPCRLFPADAGHSMPYFQIENKLVGQENDLQLPPQARKTQVFNLMCADSDTMRGRGPSVFDEQYDVLFDRQKECPAGTQLVVSVINPRGAESEKMIALMYGARTPLFELEQDQPTKRVNRHGRTFILRTSVKLRTQPGYREITRNDFSVMYADEDMGNLLPQPNSTHVALACVK